MIKTDFIFIVGPPCAGKSTYARALCEHRPSSALLSSGNVARDLAKVKGYDAVQASLASGQVAPPSAMDPLMVQKIHSIVRSPILAVDVLVVDGYPRYKDQLLDIFHYFSGHARLVVAVGITKEESWKRAHVRARGDDFRDIWEERWRVYQAQTVPMLEWLESRDHLLQIDGDGPMVDVFPGKGATI